MLAVCRYLTNFNAFYEKEEKNSFFFSPQFNLALTICNVPKKIKINCKNEFEYYSIPRNPFPMDFLKTNLSTQNESSVQYYSQESRHAITENRNSSPLLVVFVLGERP